MKGFKRSMCLFLAVLFIVLAVTYNDLVAIDEEVKELYSMIETQLQSRADRIPNMVEIAKGYAGHEEEVFTEIANARSKLNSAIESHDAEATMEANDELYSALSRLLLLKENYPELKANELFIGLMDELAEAENCISFARDNYNEKVTTYNKKVRSFPTSIFAGMAGFQPRDYFEADDGAHVAPSISFG